LKDLNILLRMEEENTIIKEENTIIKEENTIKNNGWIEQNEKTVSGWMDDLEENSFVYGEKLEKNEDNLKKSLNIVMIIAATMALITTVTGVLIIFLDTAPSDTTTTSNESNILKWVVFTLNLLVAVGSYVITITQGLVKNNNVENTIKTLSKYIQKTDSLYAVFRTELSMTPNERQNASDFIKRQDGNYMNILQGAPNMSTQDIIASKEAYMEKLKNHYLFEKRMEKEMKELKEIKIE